MQNQNAETKTAQHTPGSWETCKHTHDDGSFAIRNVQPTREVPAGLYIALICGGHPGEMEFANARLIAAAPELLKELKDCVEFCRILMQQVNETSGRDRWVIAEELKDSRAVIAKAEGRT